MLAISLLLVLLGICFLYSEQILLPEGVYLDQTRNTNGTLAYSVRTVSYNGNYAPRHVFAIWITNSSNQFVKTIKVCGNSYRSKLVKWVASSGNNTTGAVTSASLNNHQLHNVTWNGQTYQNVVVPDGDYKVNVEFAEHNATTNNPGKYKVTTFALGAAAVDTSPANETYFTNMHLVWTPVVSNGTIAGTVTSSTGTALAGATITAGSVTATSAANGSYTLPIAAGTYNVTCTKTGYTSQTQNNIVVTSSQTTTLNFSMVAIPPANGIIAGTVTSATGTPLVGATITAGTQTATSTATGAYTLSIAPGTYNVTCTQTGYVSQTINNVIVTSNQTTTQNFSLAAVPPPNGTISGTVLNASSTPVAGAIITAGSVTATSQTNGTYTLSIAPGTYSVTCTSTGYISQTQNNIIVLSNQTSTVGFNLTPVANEDNTGSDLSPILSQNFPNPLKTNTCIRYYLNKNSAVRLNVYNSKGQLVSRLLKATQPKGWHETYWNGYLASGKKAISGKYLYRLETGDQNITKTLIIMD